MFVYFYNRLFTRSFLVSYIADEQKKLCGFCAILSYEKSQPLTLKIHAMGYKKYILLLRITFCGCIVWHSILSLILQKAVFLYYFP